MLFNEIASLLDAIGFDPYLGYLHGADYGRKSLAADIMEEFRAPVVDRLTLKLINTGVFKEEDFYTNPSNQGVYFQREALKRYFTEYESFINAEFQHPETKTRVSLRKCFRIQAEKLVSAINENNDYKPFNPAM